MNIICIIVYCIVSNMYSSIPYGILYDTLHVKYIVCISLTTRNRILYTTHGLVRCDHHGQHLAAALSLRTANP